MRTRREGRGRGWRSGWQIWQTGAVGAVLLVNKLVTLLLPANKNRNIYYQEMKSQQFSKIFASKIANKLTVNSRAETERYIISLSSQFKFYENL